MHRREVAKVKRHIRREVSDYQRKITTWLIEQCDVVFVDDIKLEEMAQSNTNAQKKRPAAWLQFVTLPGYEGGLSACVRRSRRRNGKGRDGSLEARCFFRRLH